MRYSHAAADFNIASVFLSVVFIEVILILGSVEGVARRVVFVFGSLRNVRVGVFNRFEGRAGRECESVENDAGFKFYRGKTGASAESRFADFGYRT